MKILQRSLVAGLATVAVVLSSGAAANAAAFPKYKAPKLFGTTFQADPGHDFTKGIHSRRNGILRGWITYVSGGTAEYEAIKWKKGTHDEGRFVGPPEGDVRAYSSPIHKKVIFLSAQGCGKSAGGITVNSKGVGAKRCSRAELIKRVKNGGRPALITVYKSHIVQVQEIYTP